MPIQFDKFDQPKIDRLKAHLEAMASKGKAKFYEIYVDSLKAVPKTDEPSDFEGYEDYMTPDTYQIKIVIYNSAASPRNDQYVFSMKAQTNEEALDLGLNGIAFRSFTRNELSDLKESREKKSKEATENQDLKKEVKRLNDLIEDKDSYIQQLESGVMQAKANGNKIGGLHAGEILSVFVEKIIKNNAHNIAKIPALNGIAELFMNENEQSPNANSQPDAEVSFKRKEHTESENVVSDQERAIIELFKEMQKYFKDEEIEKVMEVIDLLCKDKTKITPVLELLQSA